MYSGSTALSSVRPGQVGTIQSVNPKDSRVLHKLLSLGILPGVRIKAIRIFPAFVFEVGRTQMVVDRDIADAIRVSLFPSIEKLSQVRSAKDVQQQRVT